MNFRNFLLITAIGAIFFIPFIGSVHLFDWDEVNFAECAREMLVTHNYTNVQIDYQPFWEKPPLFMWVEAFSMSVFGVNEFAARLPNAIIGIITLLLIFDIGSRLLDKRFGWIWVFTYLSSFLPHFYFKTALIDPLFNLFIFLGIHQLSRYGSVNSYTKPGKKIIIAIFAGVFIGLAILTKGPVALLLVLLTLFFVWAGHRFIPFMTFGNVVLFLIVTGIVSSTWFLLEMGKYGLGGITAFIQRQVALLTTGDAGHGGPFYFHFVVLFFGVFPASIFFFGGLSSATYENAETRNFKRWMVALLFVVLLVFTIVRTKIIHYSSLGYYPITFLGAYCMYKLLNKSQSRFNIWQGLLLALIGVSIAAVFTAVPFIAMHPEQIAKYINDPFGKANLQAHVAWSGAESAVGVFYFIVIITSVFLLSKVKTLYPGIIVLLIGTALTIEVVMAVFVPKVEQYSQAAAIRFYESKQHEKCYVATLGFKSYANLFYAQKLPPTMPSEDSLLHGHLDRPAYFVTKINNAPDYITKYHLIKTGEENGFVFMKR